MDTSRTLLLLGEDNLKKLRSKHITIVGVGGVGGYVATMLVRAGVGRVRIIDFDTVSSSNINRQIVAYKSTLGKKKVDVLEKMLHEIDEGAEIEAIDKRLTSENINTLIGKTNLVVDAIDSINDKISLIVYCKQHNIPIISSMGAGNRYSLPEFTVKDIFQTSNDRLAKRVRQLLREKGVKDLEVVTSKLPPQKVGKVVASISYYPAACGCFLSAVVVNKIIEGEI